MPKAGQVLTPEERAKCVRKNLSHPQRVRDRIRLGQLARRLQDHAFGAVAMTDSQRDAAKFLVSMAMPKPAVEVHETSEQQITINLVKFGNNAAE